MYLVFDTETTGLPNCHDAPHSDINNWPRVVQLAWEAFDRNGHKTEAQSHVIRPDGFKIPKDAEKVHGISTLAAMRTGVPLSKALDAFANALSKASVIVAHNYSFDAGIVGAEFYRLGIRQPFRGRISICTMKETTEYCRLPGRRGFKWPKLPELYLKLFRKKIAETHDAASDVATCSKCFFELKRLGVVRVTKGRRR